MWWHSPNSMKEVEIMKKRLTAILLSVALMLGLTSFAAAEGDILPTAATFDELTALIDSGVTSVEITNTIVVDAGKVLGSDDKTISLTRSADFTEDILLWVENGTLKNLNIDGNSVETQKRASQFFGDCQIENVTFTNCFFGAVEVKTGTATFSDCTFKDSSSNTGAHVLNGATAAFSNCSFSGGNATSSAGAIRNNGALTLADCSFTGNCTNGASTFQNGGAIYSIGTLHAEKCNFTQNSSLLGGAIDTIGGSNTELLECTFANNTANVGGAISNAGTATIIDTLIYKNSATEEGADLDSSSPISVSYNEGYVFSEVPSGWHNDSYDNRSGDKLFEPSFEGNGKLVFLMESDLPKPEPEPDPPVEPDPIAPVEPDPAPPTVRPSSSGRHHTAAVNKPVKPVLDKANMLYLVGYRDAVSNENITRRQVAHILYNLMSDESKKYYACEMSPFVDVGDDIAIAVLAKAKIILGYDEHYRPDTYLTMGELCTILSRFSELDSGTSSFKNIEHHWARDYVNICVSSGWLNDSTEIDLNGYVAAKDAIAIIEKML